MGESKYWNFFKSRSSLSLIQTLLKSTTQHHWAAQHWNLSGKGFAPFPHILNNLKYEIETFTQAVYTATDLSRWYQVGWHKRHDQSLYVC